LLFNVWFVFLLHFASIAATTSVRLIWHDFSLALFRPKYKSKVSFNE
jgi:hypothetical protein